MRPLVNGYTSVELCPRGSSLAQLQGRKLGHSPAFIISGFRDKPGRLAGGSVYHFRKGWSAPGISEPLAKSTKEQMCLFPSKDRA